MTLSALKTFVIRSHLYSSKAILGLLAMGLLMLALVSSIEHADAAPAVMPTIKDFELDCLKKTGSARLNTVAVDGMLSARAVVCTVEMVMFAQQKIVPAMASFMLPIGLATILLAFVLFGIRLTIPGGVRNPRGDGIIMVFKACIVIMILSGMAGGSSSLNNLSHVAVSVQTELIDWTADAFKASIDLRKSSLMRECRLLQDNKTLPANNDPRRQYAVRSAALNQGTITIHGYVLDISIWKTIDCMAGLVVGVAAGVMRDVGLFSMLLAMLSSGPLGIICFMGCLVFFLTLLSMIARSVFMVMQAYIVIGVILMFLPLVIPTIMFRKTYDYFARFLAMYIGIIFQPVIMMIFLMFAAQGIGMFLIGSNRAWTASGARVDEFKQFFGHEQKRSSMTKNPNEIYSLWQLLLFDRYETTNERVEIIQALVNSSPGSPLLTVKGMAALNLFAKYGDTISKIKDAAANPFYLEKVMVDGKEVTQRVYYDKDSNWYKNLGSKLNDFNVKDVSDMLSILRNDNSADGSDYNCSNNTAEVCNKPVFLPFLDLGEGKQFDKFLQRKYKENKTMFRDMATEEIVRDSDGNVVYETQNGNTVYEADGVTPKPLKEYFGTHPWYYGSKIDNKFGNWFMRKLFTAIIGLMLMTYIFFSLNKDVPKIAEGITGSAAYVMMGGSYGTFGGIPGGDKLESMFKNGGEEWKNRFKELAKETSNPADRLRAYITSAKDGFVRGLSVTEVKKGEMGGFLDHLEHKITGKEEEKK